MIFFLVSASVPIDMRAPSGGSVARRAGACSPGHSRSAAVARQPGEIISGRWCHPKRRVGETRRVRSPLRLSDPPVAPGFTGRRLTACNLCEAICGLELTLTDGHVTAVRGNPEDPFSRGYICAKG